MGCLHRKDGAFLTRKNYSPPKNCDVNVTHALARVKPRCTLFLLKFNKPSFRAHRSAGFKPQVEIPLKPLFQNLFSQLF
jgi:hypothetical protein